MHGGHHRAPVLLSFMSPLHIPRCLPWPCCAYAGGPVALALVCPIALFNCPHCGPLVPVHAVILSFCGPHPHCPPLVVWLPSLPGWCFPCLVGVVPMLSSSLFQSSVCSVVFLVLVHVIVVLWWDRFSTNPFFSHKKNKKEKKKKRNLMMVARHTALPPPSLCIRGSLPAHVIRPCVPRHCLPSPLLRHCHRLCSVK